MAKHPPLLHPVVRTHPVTGKQALFVNEGFTTRIVEVSEKESAALLNFLFAHVTKPEFQVRWRWQPNDVAIWDNRVTQHYANADYLPQRRIMHRATILGDKPYYRAGNACSRLRHQPRAAEKSGCCIARCFPEAAPDAAFPGDRSVGNGEP
ncbi:alpha-ketoglutarate-dependent taurine dioxygenase [Klebsiella variicola]|uniref:Alpha-ketoglutarate-dependent taurine dioxygenase n=2 Tax=Klebsiella pneumoniae complex TaxID=3390273 RepID=A0A7H4ME84_KLEVA|nr:alpha-ketoglutarate-dependent taurine dioxygenase [Klebsiella variicola]